MTAPALAPADAARLATEAARRRTFAIISHPDAGKTTLTEKLLLYGGAIHLAGAVKARRAERHATSDWMKIEQERGISVTSSVLQFDYEGFRVNLLDTPGHQDFSEDTYRTLIAADSAVMLLDNRKGVEERTRQLFEVCHKRRTPIFTFVNKCDRAGEDTLKLLDDVERDLGIRCHPITWPIFRGSQFVGVYDRLKQQVYLFERGAHHGSSRADTLVGGIDAPDVVAALGPDAHRQVAEDIELLDLAGGEFDMDAFHAGTLSPTFFGSALTNFGVEPFLREFVQLAPPPGPRETNEGAVQPDDQSFAGFVFKIQANMDPKHRDRMAFVRVVSGKYEGGATVRLTRTGKPMRLAPPQQFLARERTAVDEAWPGDVIGVHDRGTLRIGDTLAAEGDFQFAGIPRFAPEHFARVVISDALKRKQLDTGLRQLSEEGAAQVFYAESSTGPAPIVGAVGQLQFDVLLHRLANEYGAPARLERMSYSNPRWVIGDDDAIDRVARERGRMKLYDTKGRPLILFEDTWALRATIEREKELQFLDEAP